MRTKVRKSHKPTREHQLQASD